MAIECTSKTNVEDLKGFVQSAGAIEVKEEWAETGWWLGTYDKEQKLYADDTAASLA
jgi:hypothetical protein